MSTLRTDVVAAGSMILVLAVLGACAQAPAQTESEAAPTPADATAAEVPDEADSPTTTGLLGTRWQLVEFQSMDDAQGTTRPESPGMYTLGFEDGGRLAVTISCNGGVGSWSAEPAGDGSSGSIAMSLGPMTEMACPADLEPRLSQDIQWVRGYLLRDGQLALSLMADGGIYLWEPVPETVGDDG